ncbi:hypothetical protein PGTUg99_000058 [Puccinia graminis f. sp. tritici]|uniref:Uncharacterized protein n=1 Tax=Puccinia graminis f. sp. tritici TaxID=56615 RepID=A0A5B0RXY9_PUCGR|nr:hypothetical protein PGTUg99_000058 [Puccinia graminis f. sp. tritici]
MVESCASRLQPTTGSVLKICTSAHSAHSGRVTRVTNYTPERISRLDRGLRDGDLAHPS